MATAIVIAIFVALMAIGFLCQVLFLRLGLRWAGAANVSLRRTAAVVAILTGVSLGPGAAALWLFPRGAREIELLNVVFFLVLVYVGMKVVSKAFGLTTKQTFKAWFVMTFGNGVVVYALVFFLVRPFLVEGFVIPTNSMSPTIPGYHYRGKCPTCGSVAYGDDHGSIEDSCFMICEKFHTFESTVQPDSTRQPPSRILGLKFIAPRRWDIVVFHNPSNPEVKNCKRLVGLPGEVITIRDGVVCTDGRPLDMPDHLKGLVYVEAPYAGAEMWGSPDRPAQLGPDEYFVLGDNSARAWDSRYWDEGAPGHPTYAVPKAYMIGVVTHIYWPTDRMRILR